MPVKVCSVPGCGARSGQSGRCEKHSERRKVAKHSDKRMGRLNSSQRGYGYRWEKARLVFLNRYPLCVHCLEKGVTTLANEVDHIIRHQGKDDPLFWDRGNWQSLCKPCHSRKTRRESHLYGQS